MSEIMSKKGALKEKKPVEKEAQSQSDSSNPYADEFIALKKKERCFDSLLVSDQLEGAELDKKLSQLYEKTSALCNKYAWAVPDDRALTILENFGPLIEIGAGKGYWTSLLRARGVDIVAFDKFCFSSVVKSSTSKKKAGKTSGGSSETFTEVFKGGPEALSRPEFCDRNLFLCYPDEAESMAADCLELFLEHSNADYIVHVGELISTGTILGAPAAPFGRTSSADFQVSLAEAFHCVLVADLQNRYPISRDCISVWKRTKFVDGADVTAMTGSGTLENDEEEEMDDEEEIVESHKGKKRNNTAKEDASSKKAKNSASSTPSAVEYVRIEDLSKLREAALDMQYAEDRESKWAVIPIEERLPIDRAAPGLAHLLTNRTSR